jgi:hypothetical protein
MYNEYGYFVNKIKLSRWFCYNDYVF